MLFNSVQGIPNKEDVEGTSKAEARAGKKEATSPAAGEVLRPGNITLNKIILRQN